MRECVGLPVVLVVVASPSIRDAVTQNDESTGVCGYHGVDGARKVPMHRRGPAKGGGVDVVPLHEPACCPTARMSSDAASALTLLAVQADGDHALGFYLKVDFVTYEDRKSVV